MARVVDDEVADEIEQSRFVAHPCQGLVQVVARAHDVVAEAVRFILPLNKELFRGPGGAVAQALGVASRENKLNRAEKPLIENLFLVGDELAHAVGDFH